MAEAPEARVLLEQAGAPRLLHYIHQKAASGQLKRAAAQAIRQCAFKHYPYGLLPSEDMPAEGQS